MAMKLTQLAEKIGATLQGDGETLVSGCAPIDQAGPEHVTFLANHKYLKFLQNTRAAAVLIAPDTPCPENITRLTSDDPYFAFRNAMVELHGFRKHPEPFSNHAGGISAQAMIHPEAMVGEGTIVHPFVMIEAGARVGKDCVFYPGVFIGPEARVGDDCVLYPNVALYDRCVLGDRVTLHANTAIGQDGFGYATHDGVHHKIPQDGIVIIEDDVELGAGCAIERGAIGETRIGKGTKFADLISIGHGTTIGSHCLFVSLCGVSGSVEVGDYVVLGGQVGVSGHLRIGHGVQAMGRTGITKDVPDGMKVGGAPAVSFNTAKRNAMAGTELYEMVKRIRKLEKEMESLRSNEIV